jgi:hypothetical protein
MPLTRDAHILRRIVKGTFYFLRRSGSHALKLMIGTLVYGMQRVVPLIRDPNLYVSTIHTAKVHNIYLFILHVHIKEEIEFELLTSTS